MAERHDAFAELRVGLTAAVRTTDVDAAVQRFHQQRSRRRRAVAALVAVLVAVVAVPLLRTTLRPVPDEQIAAPATDPGVEQLSEPMIYAVDFADTRQGYALRTTCAQELMTNACTNELLYTDNAQDWYARDLPPANNRSNRGESRTLRVLGHDRVMLEVATQRWYSGDAGQTWHNVLPEPTSVIPSIPDGAVLEPRCQVVTTVCRFLGTILVVLPDSGRSASLANPPPLDAMVPSATPEQDGSWWVSGRLPGTAQWAMSVSRDAGRTWTTTAMPHFDGTPYAGLTVATGPGVAYALAVGELPDVDNGLLAIFRSTDGGLTWTRTWQAGTRQPRTIGCDPIVSTNGRLTVIVKGGGQYVSHDGGHSFVLDSATLGYVRHTRAGYFASYSYPASSYYHSSDGIYWTPFDVA